MGGGGGILWLLIVGALVVVPFWKLLPRFGIPNWVSIFAIFPVVALILLWIMAFKDGSNGGHS
ncbi:hypothetical protein FIU97_05205 [Roseivivax sp. THAF40]|uniref:hypothetical protein n=1 Tax=unclassified Roseivivax TaxID=2639302 RepID=UPI001268ED9A|nr:MULTISPECIES: hypothetical protein [unclassified Roseivivax]QFS82170.1 hypothetical protein FIV09_04945 [Roseivivax sp. THAF197b]QFT45970.1 hypothetical protein FIU97_05205 [Roseivivax sp. THAF40]